MRRVLRNSAVSALLVGIAGWFLWPLAPVKPVMAVASLSDPAKLATLGERGANSRLNKIVYWLHAGSVQGLPPGIAISLAQTINWTRQPRADLVKQALLRNLRIADQLGLLTPDNLERLRRGNAAVVTKGPYAGSLAEIDHIVPYSLAREVGNELANLEMMPAPVNRRKSNRVGERQLSHARKLFNAGLLTRESLGRVQAQRVSGDH